MSSRSRAQAEISAIPVGDDRGRRGALQIEEGVSVVTLCLRDELGDSIVESFTPHAARQIASALLRIALLVEGRS